VTRSEAPTADDSAAGAAPRAWARAEEVARASYGRLLATLAARTRARGERHLRRARALGRIGRFQLEAAIQSVHCARVTSGTTDWPALRKLYAGLVSVAPTLGARVALAATIGRVDGPDAGLAALEGIVDGAARRFQPAWATRAHVLADAGRANETREAYEKAISLTTESGVRRYLERRRSALTA
jgi:RNA polymerase sigma-70 factor (ECF subfamily)